MCPGAQFEEKLKCKAETTQRLLQTDLIGKALELLRSEHEVGAHLVLCRNLDADLLQLCQEHLLRARA